MLIWWAQVSYLPYAAYQIKNGGVFKHTSENSEGVTKEEIDYLLEKERDTENVENCKIDIVRYLMVKHSTLFE